MNLKRILQLFSECKKAPDLSVVNKNTIQVITERHGRVEGGADGLLGALVHGQGLEAVRVDSGPDPQVLIFDKFLLDPT